MRWCSPAIGLAIQPLAAAAAALLAAFLLRAAGCCRRQLLAAPGGCGALIYLRASRSVPVSQFEQDPPYDFHLHQEPAL